MRKSCMLIAVLMMLASSARAELPPFVSDTFDLYQLGSYQNPITYRYQASWDDEDGVHYSFGNGSFYSTITFHNNVGVWTGPNELPWFNSDGAYVNVESITMDWSEYPFEHPVVFSGYDAVASSDRTWQVEWIEPSGEWRVVHFVMGIWHGVFIDTVLCVTAAIIRAFTVDIFRF